MPMKFPYMIHRISLTADWSLFLPFACQLRMEDGEMVLWRPGFTMWVSVWGNDTRDSATARKAHFAEIASTDKFDELEYKEEGRLYYSYRLAEKSDDDRVPALYAFAFAGHGHVKIAFYFDTEKDAEIAYRIWKSINGEEATLPEHHIYSQQCFVTKMVMEDGRSVAYMYREEPDNEDDSGWRFFSGYESQEYVDEPSNTLLQPVALVAELSPGIVKHLLAPAGSQLEFNGEEFLPV